MGKGDRRTRRGKIWRKSFGKARPRNPDKVETTTVAAAAAPAPAKKPVKKAAKKAAAT